MEHLIVQNDSLDDIKPLDVLGKEEIIQEVISSTAPLKQPSYRSTPWNVVNSSLDIVDKATNGRAGLVQRLSTFILFGGIAAIINLFVFFLVFYHVPLMVNSTVHNIIASVLAAEISIMTNFMLNDRFTFRYLAGSSRSWSARCARFHITSIVGSILTFLIEFAFTSVAHIPAIIAQAMAIIIVLVYNFTFHHLFTYRHAKA